MTNDEQELARVETELAVLNALDARDLDLAEASGKPETEQRGMTQAELDAERREFIEHAHTQAVGRVATRTLVSGGANAAASLPPIAGAFRSIPYPRVGR